MDFKIIAVRPLENCNKKFSKVLTESEFYFLYNNFRIENNQVRFEDIIPTAFYYQQGKPINISAIVGKNGSGKSSVVELLYAIIFNTVFALGLFPERDDDGIKVKPANRLFAELYYQKGILFYKLVCEDSAISLYRQEGLESQFELYKRGADIRREDLQLLFYTIVINYSHYSLNSRHVGIWLKSIFHKNDGYQTPIVLNPFRKDGNIEINNEEYLTYSRLVTILLTSANNENVPPTTIRELVPGKEASHFKISLNKKKARFANVSEKPIADFLEENKGHILDSTFVAFLNNDQMPRTYITEDANLGIAYSYIVKKLYRTIERYKRYQKREYQFITSKMKRALKKEKNAAPIREYFLDLKRLQNLLEKLKDDGSHITFKLRQAINFVGNYGFYKDRIDSLIEIEDIAPRLKALADELKTELIYLIPPSFFNIDIKFKKGGYFRSLSSGEKQKIFSSASYAYHLMNLNSVVEDDEFNKYRYVNLIFDEIELYYHPDLQRTFVKDFLDNLKKISLEGVDGINCIFVTHSPFILSDIPSPNILFLNEKGLPDKDAKIHTTFGANIHDLLKHNFFLDKGYMGEFAKARINSAIDFLNEKPNTNDSYVWDQESMDKFIRLISEPTIRIGLRQLFYKRFVHTANDIERELQLLQKRQTEINNNERDDLNRQE